MHFCLKNNVRDEKYLMAFGKRLNLIRTKKGITQEILAENYGIGKNQIGLIERGEINVTICTLKIIAKNLNVTSKELLDF